MSEANTLQFYHPNEGVVVKVMEVMIVVVVVIVVVIVVVVKVGHGWLAEVSYDQGDSSETQYYILHAYTRTYKYLYYYTQHTRRCMLNVWCTFSGIGLTGRSDRSERTKRYQNFSTFQGLRD